MATGIDHRGAPPTHHGPLGVVSTIVTSELLNRLAAQQVADGSDRLEWLKARARGITATDVAQLSGPASVARVARDKAEGTGFTGSRFTQHGIEREPILAEWMTDRFDVHASRGLYCSTANDRHLATPDGIGETADGSGLILGEIKTSTKPFTRIPPNYRRQILWQQYVLGASRTVLIWEQHINFVPVREPTYVWVDRDDDQIAKLISLANQTLHMLSTVYS